MVYAFLDTNVLMHYKVFEGMPWTSILSDDNITFIICQRVFDEIDKHKDGNKTKLRNRAKIINKYLISYLEGNPKSSLDVVFCPNPSKSSTGRIDFDSSSSDEYIVFAAYEFDSNGNRKVIVTGDGGMKLRAMKIGIETILINNKSEYLLAQEPTEEEKRIKELERTLAKYVNRCSKPLLLFEDGTDTILLNKCDIPDFSTELETYRTQLKEKYPHRYLSQEKQGSILDYPVLANISAEIRANISTYTDEDYDKYNTQIDNFIDEMVCLQHRKLVYSAIDASIQEIKLSIFNKGTAPTGEIGIQIMLPKELIILSEDAFVECDMTPPVAPQLLSSFDKSIISKSKLNNLMNAALSYGHYCDSNSHDEIIEKHWNSEPELDKQFFLTLPSLNHNLRYTLDSSKSLFIPCCKIGDFIIKWTISDESNIDPLKGELVIKIK